MKKILPVFISILPICIIAVSGCNKKPTTGGELTIDIYATNDIHGQVEGEGSSIDLLTFGTFMKNMGKKDNTLLLDQGDTWQGSIYSNYNHGALINDVMCEARYSARTVGNHDFDWGVDYITANTKREYNGYTIPVLAANVYDYDFDSKTVGTTQQSDIGQKSVTYTLKNGLKVGIVGTIGQDQITSISSNYVTELTFTNHIEVMKEEAQKLKEEGCNVLIGCVHAGDSDVRGYGLSKYYDLVLCGHTHQSEVKLEGNTYFAQFGANNFYIGHIQLTYDQNKRVIVDSTVDTLTEQRVKSAVNGKYDSEIASIVDKYKAECESEAYTVLANNVTGVFDYNVEAPNIMCRAVLDEAISEGYDDVILSYCNKGRNKLPYGQWTLADIYETFPFDNQVYIAEIKGSDIAYEICNYNNICINSSFDGHFERDKTYKIACLDYLLFHTNVYRDYDYFPTFNQETIQVLDKNYREILRSWLISNGYNEGKELNPNEFSSYVYPYNRKLLVETGW